jgi:hypothetical protein
MGQKNAEDLSGEKDLLGSFAGDHRFSVPTCFARALTYPTGSRVLLAKMYPTASTPTSVRILASRPKLPLGNALLRFDQ